ncbi:MAG: hypothetical protein FRX49_06270 [Trebouxia sp. A1-2]|nr:MAG: hypothetical protein FRX49_06270 [Trebouxia sp. A1-2]
MFYGQKQRVRNSRQEEQTWRGSSRATDISDARGGWAVVQQELGGQQHQRLLKGSVQLAAQGMEHLRRDLIVQGSMALIKGASFTVLPREAHGIVAPVQPQGGVHGEEVRGGDPCWSDPPPESQGAKGQGLCHGKVHSAGVILAHLPETAIPVLLQCGEERASAGAVVKPTWLLMIKWIVPPVEKPAITEMKLAQMVLDIPNMEFTLASFHFTIQGTWRLLQNVAQHIEAASVWHAQLDAAHAMLSTSSYQGL